MSSSNAGVGDGTAVTVGAAVGFGAGCCGAQPANAARPSTRSSATLEIVMVARERKLVLGSQQVGHRRGATTTTSLQNLGAHADGDLPGRLRLYVKADRRVDAQQVLDGHAFIAQQLEDGKDAAPAADHADIRRLLAHELAQ